MLLPPSHRRDRFHRALIDGPAITPETAGEAEGSLRRAFEEAEKNVPAITLIEGIVPIAPRRDTSNDKVERLIASQMPMLLMFAAGAGPPQAGGGRATVVVL